MLKGVQRPKTFAIVCFCFREFRTVGYSGSCEEQVVDFRAKHAGLCTPFNKPPSSRPFSYSTKKSLDRALFLYIFIREVRSSGVRASITFVHI